MLWFAFTTRLTPNKVNFHMTVAAKLDTNTNDEINLRTTEITNIAKTIWPPNELNETILRHRSALGLSHIYVYVHTRTHASMCAWCDLYMYSTQYAHSKQNWNDAQNLSLYIYLILLHVAFSILGIQFLALFPHNKFSHKLLSDSNGFCFCAHRFDLIIIWNVKMSFLAVRFVFKCFWRLSKLWHQKWLLIGKNVNAVKTLRYFFSVVCFDSFGSRINTRILRFLFVEKMELKIIYEFTGTIHAFTTFARFYGKFSVLYEKVRVFRSTQTIRTALHRCIYNACVWTFQNGFPASTYANVYGSLKFQVTWMAISFISILSQN